MAATRGVTLSDAELDERVRNVLADARSGGWAPGTLCISHLLYHCRRGLKYGGDMVLTFEELMSSLARLVRRGVVGLGARDETTPFAFLEPAPAAP